ncbi:MAG: hypothetical protein U9P90_01490 [Patescibacteria group bacterium]|nr:hypothetical protein [Patescibacteria group bacterium]
MHILSISIDDLEEKYLDDEISRMDNMERFTRIEQETLSFMINIIERVASVMPDGLSLKARQTLSQGLVEIQNMLKDME